MSTFLILLQEVRTTYFFVKIKGVSESTQQRKRAWLVKTLSLEETDSVCCYIHSYIVSTISI